MASSLDLQEVIEGVASGVKTAFVAPESTCVNEKMNTSVAEIASTAVKASRKPKKSKRSKVADADNAEVVANVEAVETETDDIEAVAITSKASEADASEVGSTANVELAEDTGKIKKKVTKLAKVPKATKAKADKKQADPLDIEFISEHAKKALDLSAPVLLCPVRHHSFALSLHLPRLIAAYQPDCIAVEMPSVFKEEVSSLANSDVVPPVAFFSFVTPKKTATKTKTKSREANAVYDEASKDSNGSDTSAHKATLAPNTTPEGEDNEENYRSYLYPLLSFSPEYVALTEAMKYDIDYELIDLTSFARESFASFSEESTYYDDDQVMMRSSFYEKLLKRTGDHSFSEFWDKNFEVNALNQDTMSYLQQLYSYCYLLRYGLNEDSETFMVQRELFMLKNLQAAMKTHKRVLVVTGGLHSVALCDYLYYKKKKVTAQHFAKVPSETYLIPYSFVGADSQQGYGAGIVFPYYYQQFYQVLKEFVPFSPWELDKLSNTTEIAPALSDVVASTSSKEVADKDTSAIVSELTAIVNDAVKDDFAKHEDVKASAHDSGVGVDAVDAADGVLSAKSDEADKEEASDAVDVEFFTGIDRSNLAFKVLSSLLKCSSTAGAVARKAAQEEDLSKLSSRAKRGKGQKNKVPVYYDALGNEINVSVLTGTSVEKTERSQLILSLAQKEQQDLGSKSKKNADKSEKADDKAVATATSEDSTINAKTLASTVKAAKLVDLTLSQKEALLNFQVPAEAIVDANYALNLFFIGQLRDYRKQKFSTADKISCEQSLRGLANLRQKLVPSVFELIDAVKSTLIKEELSDRYYLLDQLMLLLTSVRMGQVPLNVRMPPLWRDFLHQCKTYGINLKDQQPHQIRVDINKDAKSLAKSRLINRIAFLSPAFLPHDLNAEGNHTFNYISRTETYVYKYSDEVVMQMMGASVHGESLLQACRTVLCEYCKSPNLTLTQICALYRQCVNMGIEDQYYHVKELLALAILQERQLVNVGQALSELNSYDFVAKSTPANKTILLSLIYDLVKRGCEILLQQDSVEEGEIDDFVKALEELNYYAIKYDNSRQLYFSVLEELLHTADLGAALQGAYLALLYKNRRLRYEVLVGYVNQFVLGSINNSKQSGGFFYTLILISRGNLFNRDSILSLLNTYLDNLDGDEFLKVLVLLRRVFMHFNSVELHKLVRMLKRLLGLDILNFTYQVEPQEFLRNRQIDQELEQDMRKWHLLANSASSSVVTLTTSDAHTAAAVSKLVAPISESKAIIDHSSAEVKK